jgi:hypothetical protein
MRIAAGAIPALARLRSRVSGGTTISFSPLVPSVGCFVDHQLGHDRSAPNGTLTKAGRISVKLAYKVHRNSRRKFGTNNPEELQISLQAN